MRYGWLAGGLFEEAKPDGLRPGMVFLQPLPELCRAFEVEPFHGLFMAGNLAGGASGEETATLQRAVSIFCHVPNEVGLNRLSAFPHFRLCFLLFKSPPFPASFPSIRVHPRFSSPKKAFLLDELLNL